MSDESFDLVVIGGGPGGYVCALRAAQLGLSVACIDRRETLGGTCLNVGCIPSKALLHSSHLYHQAQHDLAGHGIGVSPTLDLGTMMARKDKVVGDLTKGIDHLFRKHKITRLTGSGRLAGPTTVEVSDGPDAGRRLEAANIVLATGSEPTPLTGVAVDEDRIVSSTGALALAAVPEHLVVIGGGVIGLELGSVWRRLGAKVTVVEFLDRLVPAMDGELAKTLQRSLKKQGLTFRLGTRVTGAETGADGVTLTLTPAQGDAQGEVKGDGAADTLTADRVLVAVGRRPVTEGLGLETVGITLDERGFVPVDHAFTTRVPSIRAIGDVIGGAMLAHKAEDEGVAVAEWLAGQRPEVNYDAIPAVVYTHPEAAGAGATEEALKADGIAYRVGKFPFSANSRARTLGESEGFVKLLADADTDRVLGVHILGPMAGDLIMEPVLGLEFQAAAEDIARTSHAHPQLGEAVKEAALALGDGALHM